MLETLSGIETLVRLAQYENAEFPMFVTEYPPNVFVIDKEPE